LDGKDRYQVESDFEDLHPESIGDDDHDLSVDLSDPDNPIVRAYEEGVERDDDWTPPDDDQDPDDEDLDGDEDDTEEDDGESDDDHDDNDDDEDGNYSRNVRKRIKREQNLREDAERRAEALEARLGKVEQRLSVQDSADELQKLEAETESKVKELRDRKRRALDDGDVDAQIEIDEQILDAKAELKAKQIELRTRRETASDLGDPDDRLVPSGTPKPGLAWLKKHPEFHSDSRFRNAVLGADKYVASLGYDRNTTEYYEVLERHVKGEFPDYFKPRNRKGDNVDVRSGKSRRKSAVGGTGTESGQRRGSQRTRRGQVRLTKADQENMRRFNLDPTNPEHCKQYAANKSS